MFATTGSRGLYKVPLSKGLLLVLSGLTVWRWACGRLVCLDLKDTFCCSLLIYNFRIFERRFGTRKFAVWRWACGRLVCLDLKDTFCCSLLIYNFRIFERRFGTRKFASFLWGTWVLSAYTDILLAQAVYFLFDHEVEELPAGLLSPVFSLFVPFYLSIPREPVTQVLGRIPITNKTLVYIVGLQLLTSSPFMWLLALSGLISGGLYYNVLWLQRVLFVPVWLSKIGPEPTGETPLGMGATLDIQRQQRMDLLDQQLLLAEYNQARRHAQPQPRHTHPSPPPQPSPLDHSPAAEEQVARLVEMGFSRMDALEALRASNNDINMATNFLLQH
ncbi:hypothetical protein CRUP_021553 [Coryphaenoides rupestris]|nr:hypothetical protein CRUP_021553 [Coryphaenoides rupestris]